MFVIPNKLTDSMVELIIQDPLKTFNIDNVVMIALAQDL